MTLIPQQRRKSSPNLSLSLPFTNENHTHENVTLVHVDSHGSSTGANERNTKIFKSKEPKRDSSNEETTLWHLQG
ncbi:hypothetical protein I3760_05G102800 [Carya illinoinensis]|nr:hypothetical protein I3760_05G102800 [Carya illinoinensis]